MTVDLTFQGETLDDVLRQMRLALAQLDGNAAPGPYTAPQAPVPGAAPGKPSVPSGTAPPSCPNGHGPMRYRRGGTISSGERIGQPYPPFWSCGECRETVEIQQGA